MKALGLVVSEKKIFFMFFPSLPRGGAHMDPRGKVGRIYKEDHYTLLLIKYESSGPCGFREDFFYVFYDPRGGAFFDPRGMNGMIYIEDH